MKTIAGFMMMALSSTASAQSASTSPAANGFTFDTNLILLLLALFLLLPIWILSNTFIAAAKRYYHDKLKSGGTKMLLLLGFLLTGPMLIAQGASMPASSGLSANGMTIFLICVIGAEMLLLIFFARKTNEFIRKLESKATVPVRESDLSTWLKAKWTAMNFKPIEEEHTIDTGHDYDGIRELDNVIPPWFTTAFLLTILFAGIYLYRYHIAKSAPLQIEEYEMAVAKAELKHDEYLKRQASSIDENNVTIMTGDDLEAGKKVFVTLCAICHKTDGGGMVGPNFTDDYWIHGGSLKDIFRTVKYGVPDKGMISWKDQLSPVQMAQVCNYILTLKGTNPPDAKEKQGTLYVPEAIASDTITSEVPAADTLIQK